jgi:hypothetical protein
MQKTTLVFLLSLGLVLSVANAEAKTTKRTTNNNSTTTEQIETHQAASEHHSGGVTVDLGVSSIFPVSIINGSTGGSLTAIIHVTNLDMIQILAGVTGTTSGFGFGVGGQYKRTVLGNQSAGFHLGGGIGLGTAAGAGGVNGSSTNFAMDIVALVGAHFDVPGTQIAFHLDGGPVFALVSISGVNGIGGSTSTSFAMGPLSGLLGASVVYAF